MSNNNRGRDSEKSGEQKALLDELDSLKALLNKEKEKEDEELITAAPWEYTPPAKLKQSMPTTTAVSSLKEASDNPSSPRRSFGMDHQTVKSPPHIPVLEEVVLPQGRRASDVPELTEVVDIKGDAASETPDNKELLHLIDMLVERQLNKLKPVLTRQVISELERLYPSLKKR